MLAAEGFLPGYGLETGAVVGWAEIPFWRTGAMDFSLPRAPATALREYVPGNLIYANGHRFVARRFHRDLDEEHAEMPWYEVSTDRQAVTPSRHGEGSLLGGHVLRTMAVCDADLIHTSHISDEEDLRFSSESPSTESSSGSTAAARRSAGVRSPCCSVTGFACGSSTWGHRPPSAEARSSAIPSARCAGQSVSPLSSERQREEFRNAHAERCAAGRPKRSASSRT